MYKITSKRRVKYYFNEKANSVWLTAEESHCAKHASNRAHLTKQSSE